MSPEEGVFPIDGDSCNFPRDLYDRVQEYSDNIRSSPEFIGFLAEFAQMGEPENKRFLKRGIANSIDTLETIYETSCASTRELYLKRVENGLIAESWIEETVFGCPALEDPSQSREDAWVAVLKRVKEKDMKSVLNKITEGVDTIQASGFRRSAEVIGFGHDLIISRVQLELAGMAGIAMPSYQS